MNIQKTSGKPLPLVVCEWLDAYTVAGWENLDPSEELTTTYGLLAYKDRKWVVLAMTHCPGKDEGYFGNLWYIPRSVVRSIRTIDPEQMPRPVVSDPPSALPPTGDHVGGGSTD